MKTIRVGHSPSNDCVLENPTVSRSHAIVTIDPDGVHATIKDLNSTNGTFVNNNPQRIVGEVRVLMTDIVRFGSERMLVKDLIGKSNKTVVRQSKPTGMYAAEQRTIGKATDNNIVLNYDDVSRKHALLYKDANGNVVIEDLNSTNGTYVNGIKVTSQILHAGDKVTITRKYLLEWENVFLNSNENKPHKKTNTSWMIAAILAAIIIIGGGYITYIKFFDNWSKEKIYKEYHSAVCWIYVQYGYQIQVDGEDFTPMLCKVCQIPVSSIVHIEGEKLMNGPAASQGTGFFISNDGKIATNLHISRPWLFSDDMKDLEKVSNQILAYLATENPMLSRSKVEVKCVLQNILAIPDGLPVSDANAVECEEIKGYDDIQKDVAILQTKTRKLPTDVTNIIDVNDADASEASIAEGKNVYTIGFPYGADIAMDSNKDLRNQVHGGSVTQNRGDYEFGHDAETASGASGSPILNEKGRLIGVHHAGLTGVTGAQGFNMAIKVKYLLDLLNQ